MADRALSVLLSQVLVAMTIEMDNAHEARLLETWARPFKTSFVMWSTFLRHVGEDGIAVEDLTQQTCVARSVLASTVGGMERWGYVAVDENPADGFVSPRKGHGTATGVKPETVLWPTQAGTIARRLWAPLPDEIEQRWRERLDDRRIDDLRTALRAMVAPDVPMPRFLPVLNGKGLFAAASVGDGMRADDDQLPALLSRALLTLTLAQERDAAVSCAIGANVLRVLGEDGIAVGAVPALACVSKEAVAMSLTWLEREGYVSVEPVPGGRGKQVTRTAAGGAAQSDLVRRRDEVETACDASALREALGAILDDPQLGPGLAPPPGGWRGTGRYKPLTDAFVTDPSAGLPHHPMVLHRGGWPDGS